MIITPAVIKALFTGFNKNFQDGLKQADSQYQQLATVTNSTSASTTYGWLGQVPNLREWVGDRSVRDMQAHGYAIVNKHFESTVGVNRDDIEDDNIGVYGPLMQEMGLAAGRHPDLQVFDLLKQGEVQVCYDGQPFFDTEHPVYANTDGTGAATLTSNLFTGAAAPWYLLDTSRAIKPLIYQQRKAMTFTNMNTENDEAVFMKNQYRFGVDGRNNVGFGFWQMAAKSAEALTAENFSKVYSAMVGQKGDGGIPLGIKPTILLVPPSLEDSAKKIVEMQLINGGESNVHFGKAKVMVSPWLL